VFLPLRIQKEGVEAIYLLSIKKKYKNCLSIFFFLEKKMSEVVVLLGYFNTLEYYCEIDFKDSWGRTLPFPLHGETVLCGYLESNPFQKVEIWIGLDFDLFDDKEEKEVAEYFAVGSLELVSEFSQELTFVCIDSSSLITFPSQKPVYDYQCPFFQINNSQWNSFDLKKPFFISDTLFQRK